MAARRKADVPAYGPVRAGLEETLNALDLTPDMAATVASARVLADAVEVDAGNAALWREYRATVGALTEAAAGDDDDSSAIQLTFRTPRIRG